MTSSPEMLPLQERELHLPHAQYAYLLELYARYAKFNDDGQFLAEASSQFGLRPFTHYKIVIDRREP